MLKPLSPAAQGVEMAPWDGHTSWASLVSQTCHPGHRWGPTATSVIHGAERCWGGGRQCCVFCLWLSPLLGGGESPSSSFSPSLSSPTQPGGSALSIPGKAAPQGLDPATPSSSASRLCNGCLMPKKHLQISFLFSLYLKKKSQGLETTREYVRSTHFAKEKLGSSGGLGRVAAVLREGKGT